MNPTPEIDAERNPLPPETEPITRDRYADLVEEGRIARAGGGAFHVSPLIQSLIYLILVLTLLGMIAMGFWR